MSKKNWTTEELFTRLLNNKSKKSYWEHISILRSRPDEDVFRQCVELTTSDIPKNRIIGIDVLAQLGVPPRSFYNETIDTYFELLENEKDPIVIMSILYGIGHSNENLNKTQINDKHQDTKLEAIAGLAKRKDIRIKEIIKRELLDGEYGTLLFEAIVNLNDKDFLPLLYQNLKLAEDSTDINPEWIKELKLCITKLEKIMDEL